MIQLYHKGDTHIVRGIKCKLVRVKAKYLESMLSQGWVKDPVELDGRRKKKLVIEKDGTTES